MTQIFELLFSDYSGQLVAANLHAAERGQVLEPKIIVKFARVFPDLQSRMNSDRPARSIAEDIVFSHPKVFQLAGPAIRPPRKDLINIQELSRVHYVLAAQDGSHDRPPSDPADMLGEVRAFIAARPDDPYGRKDRLLWIAEQDEAVQANLEWLLSHGQVRSDEGAERLERVMLYYGLPIQSGTTYLVTEFSAKNWGSHSNDATYRRPTAFDGVDGDYFKQRRLCESLDHSEWNRTADLMTARQTADELGDGAWEAVGIPLQMARITRTATVLSSIDAKPFDRRLYVDCIRKVYTSSGIDWEGIPRAMTAIVHAGEQE
jgi:hypothetical protein